MKSLPRLTPLWFCVYALICLFGLALRLHNLAWPHAMVFDETYYAKDAWSLWHSGFERQWPEKADEAWLRGDTSVLSNDASFVVHPPLGKWMIALGYAFFPQTTALSWRIMPALFGALMVPLTMVSTRLLLRSHLWAALAGFLVAIDGMALVMSRTALLDIFLAFFLLTAFTALLLHRRRAIVRIASGQPLPRWNVPWLWAMGLCLGAALGVKWSAASFALVFGLFACYVSARRRILATAPGELGAPGSAEGAPGFRLRMAALADAAATGAILATGTVSAYLVSWWGWFSSDGGWGRHWAETHEHPSWIPEALASWWNYHLEAYRFHNQLDSPHPYQSTAYSWLVQGRPTSFYYQEHTAGQAGCAVAKCSSAITDLGNPLLWWAASLALISVLAAAVLRRDLNAAMIVGAVGAGLGPWFLYPDRTMFTFYSVSFEPYLVMGLVFGLAMAFSWARGRSAAARRTVWGATALLILAITATSLFFWPLWTGEVIPYPQWRQHMWFDTWI